MALALLLFIFATVVNFGLLALEKWLYHKRRFAHEDDSIAAVRGRFVPWLCPEFVR